MESKNIWVNGKVLPAARAAVSALDHGFLYGDGCFESIVIRAGRAFRFEEHMARLFRSLRALHIDVNLTAGTSGRAIADTLAANHLDDAYVKLVVTRGQGKLPVMTPRDLRPNVVLFADPFFDLVPSGPDGGIRLKTVAVRRNSPGALDPKIKSLNYLNQIMAKIEALECGYDDGLFLDDTGHVAEASAFNIFAVRSGIAVTPDSASCLDGITRSAVEDLLTEERRYGGRCPLTLTDIYGADEVFLTSTAGGIIPVGTVDGRVIGDGKTGPITALIKERYEAELLGERWTTSVRDLAG